MNRAAYEELGAVLAKMLQTLLMDIDSCPECEMEDP